MHKGTYELREAVKPVDRRQEPREAADALVTIVELPEQKLSIPGLLSDISHSGLGLTVFEHVPHGTWIAAEWNGTTVLGHTVHCAGTDGKYRVGIRTDYVIQDRINTHSPVGFSLN